MIVKKEKEVKKTVPKKRATKKVVNKKVIKKTVKRKVRKKTKIPKKIGRPNEYLPKELKLKAIEFFLLCDVTKINKGINGIISRPKTMSGLRVYLSVGKNYFSNKYKEPLFKGTVEYIRNIVENDVEEKTLTGVCPPSAGNFNLKNNFNRADKVINENNNTNTNHDVEDSEEFKDILKANKLI